jgi:hypothetical protein
MAGTPWRNPAADHHPVPVVDGDDQPDQMGQPGLVEVLRGVLVHLVGYETSPRAGSLGGAPSQDGHGLGQRERGPLPLVVDLPGLLPGVQQVELAPLHAQAAGETQVHVEAERAAVELRGADHDQFGEGGVAEALLRGGAHRLHRVADPRVQTVGTGGHRCRPGW